MQADGLRQLPAQQNWGRWGGIESNSQRIQIESVWLLELDRAKDSTESRY